ncbi:MAG: DNA repair protein RecN [Gammaproteobacteria bacterium]|nr:DNA repair protein RecN [Gammaproteobacteria bacterium]
MLKALTIQELAIVRHLDLEFRAGLTVITGETGAGKSIVVDALGLVLGDRADSSMVRAGAERAVVSAGFDIVELPALTEYLALHSLDCGGECLLRRVIGADGRSRAFCNESPVTLQVLKEIGAFLVDIHGQHEHHSLLQRGTQRRLLDEYARLKPELSVVATAYGLWQDATNEWQALNGAADPTARAEFLRFQIDELDAAGIDTTDILELEAEHKRQSHRQRLAEACDDVTAKAFKSDRAALKVLTSGHHQLRDLEGIDSNLKPVVELFDQALINLVEAERELSHYLQRVAGENVEGLAQLERRIGQLHDLGRKHRCEAGTLPKVLEKLRQELRDIETRDARNSELEVKITQARAAYDTAAEALTAARNSAVKPMADAIIETLRQLGLPHAEFSIELTMGFPSFNGNDEIEFLVTTNPDQALRPLRKVASGGELSRASLAVQVATASIVQVPSLVYDEVDTGIGGRVASVVAQHLRMIAMGRQVLCVTHLAQVASAGNHHLVIAKNVADGVTLTAASYLGVNDRIEEVARMLGGAQPTARSRAHAKEMLTE